MNTICAGNTAIVVIWIDAHERIGLGEIDEYTSCINLLGYHVNADFVRSWNFDSTMVKTLPPPSCPSNGRTRRLSVPKKIGASSVDVRIWN